MKILLEAGPSLRGWSNQDVSGACPQAWAYTHLLARPHAPGEPLVKGALVHIGLCHLWSDRLDGGDPRRYGPLEAIDALAHEEDAKLAAAGIGAPRHWQQFVPLAQAVLTSYIRQDPHRHLRPLAVEHHVELWIGGDGASGRACLVEAPPDADVRRALAAAKDWRGLLAKGPPYLSTFRMDLLAYDAGRRVSGIDWKTGFRLDNAKIQGFRAAGQFLQYQLWGPLAYGQAWAGTWVGFINLGDLRGGGEPAFDGFGVTSAPEAVAAFPQAVWDRSERLRALFASPRPPDNWPRAYSEQGPCSNRYGRCDHFDRCVGVSR